MKKRGRLRKGLAMLLAAAMVVGMMPGVGTMKVSAAEGEASGSVAVAEGYDADGFCTSYELTNGTWALKSGETCTHGDCNGYQPAVERKLDYDINGDKKIDAKDKAYKITNAGQLYWFAGLVNGTLAGVTQNKSANAVLTANITVNENVLKDGVLNSESKNLRAWTPIGPNTDNRYYGSFDGQGYTVSGLYFNDTSVSFVGLFGWSRGTIKNVGVVASYLKG